MRNHDPEAWRRSNQVWPNQTELEIRIFGKRWHHDLHCNHQRGPMGGYGCSCYYAPGRRLDKDGRPK